MKSARNTAAIALLACIMLSLLSVIFMTGHNLSFRVTFGISFLAFLVSITAIPYFLASLSHFKQALRHAYSILCYGIGLMGLAQIQLPITNYFNWLFWQDSGAIAVPYFVGIICIFIGVKRFAQIFSVRGLWTSLPWAFIISVVLSCGALFLPHVQQADTDEVTFHVSLGITILDSVFATFAAITLAQVRQKIGPIYHQSMTWLYAGVIAFALGGWHYFFNQLAIAPGNWYYDFSISLLPFAAAGVCFVISGVAFNEAETELTEMQNTPKQASERLLLDIVLYIASLASNPSDIDPILDEVRMVTSRLTPDQPLPADDLERLAQTYSKLEGYLAAHDPLRAFTPQDLQNKVSQRFAVDPMTKILLWPEGRSANG